ncbi:MAG: hypothetical protein M3139_07840 [Bacteroidota bacterium]|nr:hypothetical protein [Bacteroidota bacterium]
MKIRISENSIRFRLKQQEVKYFMEEGEIKEEISFGFLPMDKLSFVLKASKSGRFKIIWESNTVILHVPEAKCEQWTNTDLVGFEEDVTTEGQATKSILVEKDFQCLDGTEADNEDAYPNPNQFC